MNIERDIGKKIRKIVLGTEKPGCFVPKIEKNE